MVALKADSFWYVQYQGTTYFHLAHFTFFNMIFGGKRLEIDVEGELVIYFCMNECFHR